MSNLCTLIFNLLDYEHRSNRNLALVIKFVFYAILFKQINHLIWKKNTIMTGAATELWGIVYVSAASMKLTNEEMVAVIQEVKSDCQSKNISGILIHAEGNLLCYMEGTKDVITSQFKQVARDVRQKNLVKLFDNSISFRYFDEFGMTFKFLDKAFAELDDFNTAGKSDYLLECLNMDDIAMKRVSEFIKNNK